MQIKGKPPMVILCTEDQLKEVKNLCVTHKDRSILGVDIIFNLGDCFVTLTVFKNTHLSQVLLSFFASARLTRMSDAIYSIKWEYLTT